MKTKIAPFAPMSDTLTMESILDDIKRIADPRGFIGNNKPKHDKHCANIYVGTEDIVAKVGDGVLCEENLGKKGIFPKTQKPVFVATLFNMDNVKTLEEKYSPTEYKYELSGTLQMITCVVDLKKPVEVSYRPKARPFKKDFGIMGDLDVIGKIDGQKYSFCPELQKGGMRIKVSKR